MGFRTCYPEIWHLGVLYILSWRNLRTWQSRKVTLSSSSPLLFFPVTHHNILTRETPSHCSLQRHRDTKKNPNKQAVLSSLKFITCSSYSLTCFFLRSSVLFTEPSINIQRSKSFFGFSFPYSLSSCKTDISMFSSINLSF